MKRLLVYILIVSVLLGYTPYSVFAKTAPVAAKPLESLLYYTDTDNGYASLVAHAKQIDIISAQAFTFDSTGIITGGVPDRAAKIIAANKIHDMPLVENANFSMNTAHTVLTNPTVQDTLINQLVTVGLQNGYWGWQMDMEHMDAADRPLFTAFSQKLGNALHAKGLMYSVAVVAKVSDDPADYSNKSWYQWAGVFDYAPLAESADFLSIMLYDQDDSIGPVSSVLWYQKVLAYSTGIVPASKLSVGIPFYAWEWDPGDGSKIAARTYKYVLDQVKAKTVQNTTYFESLGANAMTYFVKASGVKYKRVLWYENITTFKQKYDLLKKYGVRGFSGWAIGQEDARDWTLLPVKK